MAPKTVIRTDLVDAICQKVDISRTEATELVSQVLGEICEALASGETVKLSGFGIFRVRDKAKRVGRNPKTGIEVPIEPRRSITFQASPVLKTHVNRASSPSLGELKDSELRRRRTP
ncbi:integration host factor subunit alpha [Microvirga sp. KLBC 81]|uniref:Integration host factor subunit alpha n=1 Tax=Microvirga vignae TaxID=1225564 RepID=A0A0H1RBA2_9HYPH|nr:MULTISPECIES: integration host factor subunit alpha [Microvirga]KLK92515.1 integration host factor subunit alpha [Microvirga vignae]PVE24035.1 integration host factor subunit alpha [Microvirga sp. KLBC 81]